MAKCGFRLEKVARGYDVLNERENWFGDIVRKKTARKNEWVFVGHGQYGCTVKQLGEIAKLMKGLDEKDNKKRV